MSKIMKQKLADGTEYVPSREGIPARSIAPSSVARWVTGAVLFLVLVYFLFPVYWVIVASTKTNSQLVSTNGFWFDDINVLKNHETLMVWTRGMFWRWVFNSLLYSTVAGVVGTLISVMAGYATAKFKFPGKGVTMGVIMSGLLMPAALLTIPLYIIFHHIGITNTMWAIIIPACEPIRRVLGPCLCPNICANRTDRSRPYRWRKRSPHLLHDGPPPARPGHGDHLPLHFRRHLEQLPPAVDDGYCR